MLAVVSFTLNFPFPPAMSPVPLQTQHAAVLYGSKDLRYEERTLWPPRPNEAQVKVVATGLCGSDRTSTLSYPCPSALGCSPMFDSPLLRPWPEWRFHPPGTLGPRSRVRWHRNCGWF